MRHLVMKCRAGESRFYEPLVRAYEGRATRIARGMLGDRRDAEEAVQDAFVRAYRALDRFDAERRFGPWLHSILRNVCRDRLRSRRGREEREIREAGIDQRPDGGSGAPGTEGGSDGRRTARRVLERGLERISAKHREVLVLKELEGYGYSEIAQLLDVPEGTVGSRLYHARTALREALEDLGHEGYTP